jgi:uncharacterized membrane protein
VKSKQGRRFASKVDRGYLLLLAALVAVGVVLGAVGVTAGRWWVAVLLSLPVALMVWNLLGTYYVVTEDSLVIRCLLSRTTVRLDTVRALRASHDPRSSPALSRDRIDVEHDGGSVLVSPREKAAFIRAIRAASPSASVEGLPDAR